MLCVAWFCFRYFVTLKVTVFEVALPFLGVTVTVTLHEPFLSTLRVDPETLQYLDDAAASLSEMTDPVLVANLA